MNDNPWDFLYLKHIPWWLKMSKIHGKKTHLHPPKPWDKRCSAVSFLYQAVKSSKEVHAVLMGIDLLPLLWEISSWFQLPPLLVCWHLTPHSSCSEPLHHHEEKLVCTFSTAFCLIECLQRAGGGGVNPGIFARKVPASTKLRLGSFDPPEAFQGHYIYPKLWWNLKVWSMGNPPKVAAVQW